MVNSNTVPGYVRNPGAVKKVSRSRRTGRASTAGAVDPGGVAEALRRANDGGFPLIRNRHPSRQASALQESIRRDGGLAFLRFHLEAHLRPLFAGEAGGGTDAAPAFAESSTVDSPEAVGERIASFALGLFSIYRKQNPELDPARQREGFEREIRRGIVDGFARARGILSGMNLLDDEVDANIERTRAVVDGKLSEAFGD